MAGKYKGRRAISLSAAAAPPPEQKKPLWPLVVWAAVLLAVGFAGIFLLRGYRLAAERSRPELFMEEFLTEYTAEELLDAAAKHPDFAVTRFEDPEEIFTAFRALLPLQGRLRCERELVERDSAIFTVYAGEVKLCRVSLLPGTKNLGFGRHDWQLDRISTGELAPQLQAVTAEISCLPGEQVRLNGLRLSDREVTDPAVSPPDLTEVERRGENMPQLIRYTVGPLYGSIHVTDGEGREYAPRLLGDTLRYELLPEERYSLSITALRGMTVSVNGSPLLPEDISSGDLGILEGYADGQMKLEYYHFDGLYRKPEVTATDALGRTLRPLHPREESYVFLGGSEEGSEELAAEAEAYFTAYMDYVAMPGGAQYSQLLYRIQPGSRLYSYVAQSTQAMIWAPLTRMTYEDLRVDNVRRLGEDCFFCTVEFSADMTSSYWRGVETYPVSNAYELVFVLQDGRWLCAAMGEVK